MLTATTGCNRLDIVRRFVKADFRMFDRPAVTAMQNVHNACTDRSAPEPILRRFLRETCEREKNDKW